MTDLRQRLIDAELGGARGGAGPDGKWLWFLTDEDAADAALAVFVAYLRELAEEITAPNATNLDYSDASALRALSDVIERGER